MFSSRFMLYPTFLKHKIFQGGGALSFHVFFAFYAISNIFFREEGGGGGGGCKKEIVSGVSF